MEKLLIGVLVVLAFSSVIVINLAFPQPNNHFAWLAGSFWQGRLDLPAAIIEQQGPIDSVLRDGRFYWPLGPLPAVLLMPFALFVPIGLLQPVQQILIVLGLAYLAYRLARRSGLASLDSVWMSLLFCFGSVSIGVVFFNAPWPIGNTLAALCVLLALNEARSRNRPAVVGLFAGLAWLTRLTAGLGAVFFFVLELLRPGRWREKAGRLAGLAAPIAVAVLLAALYNYLRFGNPFDTGHAGHFLQPGSREALTVARYGVFHPANIARNFYFYFLKLPDWHGLAPVVSHYGVSFFLLSPAFLLAARARRRSPEFLAAVAATAAVLPVFMCYFTTGYVQFGPRYLLDILPYWFLVLLLICRQRGGVSGRYKSLIFASILFNIYLFFGAAFLS